VGCVTPRQALSLFLLFLAVFAANYQPSTSRFPQKSWTAHNLANERTAETPLFFCYFRCSYR